MDSTNGKDSGKSKQQDLVIVDRNAIKQLLWAVINTLNASANLEQMSGHEEADQRLLDQMGRSMTSAREALVHGVQQLMVSVDELPSVQLHEDQLPTDQAERDEE